MPSEDVLLFAGQGTRTIFSEGSSKTLLDRVSQNHIATLVLTACHNALLQDFSALSNEEKTIFTASDLKSFMSAQDLINPPSTLGENPVVQATTLYVHQILEYILYAVAADGEASIHQSGRIKETTGFCSGILPALVVAEYTSVKSSQFLTHAVGAFRVAFWIAIRSALYSKVVAGPNWRDLPWSLVVAGLSRSDLETFLRDYNSTSPHHIRISAILGDSLFSLSGTGTELYLLQSHLPTATTCRPAFIHTCYHGGDDMEDVLQSIVQDVQRLQIPFPDWDSLRIPVRSTIDGNPLTPMQSKSNSLLDAALHCMLIHPVHWKLTFENILESASQRLEADSNLQTQILALGPNSGSLLSSGKGASLHNRLVINHMPTKESAAAETWRKSDIAIVGMSADIPGTESLQDFWDILQNGTSVATEIPSSRFDLLHYYDKEAGEKPKPRRMATKHGNFLNHPFHFDNSFFSISPREAKSMDPQQRLLLQTALSALEDAGYAPNTSDSFQPDKMGVFVGAATGDYVDNAQNNIDVYYSPGTLRAFLSGRISYAFEFKGPSVVIDTACSSSLVAIHQACMALETGDCVSALAGAVNVISSPDMYLGLSRAHFLSPTGQCKPFDVSADGYCRAESSALFVLKRLSDAIAHGDRIHGVIRGTSINQSGASKSITHPDADTQVQLFNNLLAKSKVPAQTISVVEAHGTGTQAGDFIEVSSLQTVFGQSSDRRHPLLLSSIKGNIGHAEAASGSVGLAKLLLMLRKKQIPPQASFRRLNPRLSSIADHNIVIPTQLQDWACPYGTSRRALLNSFGAAGSNAALILEEFRGAPRSSSVPPRSAHVLNISAKTSKALEELRSRYLNLLRKDYYQRPFDIADLCYSANARRQQYTEFRISIVGNSIQDLAQKLEHASATKNVAKRAQDVTVFLFSGQADLYRGMGAELLSTAPVFREAVLQCSDILQRHGFERVEHFIANDDVTQNSLEKGEDILAQCACFVLQYALVKLWQSWGVEPQVVIGHSMGEYAAFVASGTLSLDDALLLVAKRAQLMVSHCTPEKSGMIACKIPATAVRGILTEVFEDPERLVVSCDNSPKDCVVAGDLSDLERFVCHCKTMGIKAKQLKVPFAFHSPAMEPITEAFSQLCSNVEMKYGPVPIVSSRLGRVICPDDLTSNYLPGQTRHVVNFSAAIWNLTSFAAGSRIRFLEIGHSSGTTSMAKIALKETQATYAVSLRSTESPWATISGALRSFYLESTPMKWNEVYKGSAMKYLDSIPKYPLSTSEFLMPFQEATIETTRQPSGDLRPVRPGQFFQLVKKTSRGPTGASFETNLSLLSGFIKSHIVGGTPLCPASVYTELALEALDQYLPIPEESIHVLRDINFESPLILSDNQRDHDRIEVILGQEDSRRQGLDHFFKVESRAADVHCTGVASVESALSITSFLHRKTAFIKKHVDLMRDMNEVSGDTFSSRMIYDVVFPRVVSYSGPFLTLKRLHVGPSGLEGYGIFRLPMSSPAETFACNPALVDTLLHTAGFVANNRINRSQACICVKVENITVLHEKLALSLQSDLSVYCNLVDCVEGFIVGDAYAMSKSGEIIATAEGMHFKKTGLRAFQDYLARLAQRSHQRPEQKTHVLKRATAKNLLAPAHSTLNKDIQITQDPSILDVLHQEIRRLCETDTALEADGDLAQLGIDSLLFIELAHALRQKLPHVDSAKLDLSHCTTLREVETLLLSAARASPPYNANVNENGILPEAKTPSIPGFTRLIEPPRQESANTTPEASQLGVIETMILEICGFALSDVEKDTSLESLGVDSLLSIELEQGLRQMAGISIDQKHGIISELTVRQLEELILEKLTGPSPVKAHSTPIATTTYPATRLQDGHGTNSRIYLFHDGSGLSHQYARIDTLGYELQGVSSLDFASIDESITDLKDFASRYISVLKLADGARDTILGGWSFGGVLASEIARQLQDLGTPAKGLLLLDSPCPIDHEPIPDAIIAHVAGTALAGFNTHSDIRSCIEAQFKRNTRLLQKYNPPLDAFIIPTIMLLSRETFDSASLCGPHYAWLDDREFRTRSVRDWERIVGSLVPVLEVEGNHFDMFSVKHLNTLSRQLAIACKMLGL